MEEITCYNCEGYQTEFPSKRCGMANLADTGEEDNTGFTF